MRKRDRREEPVVAVLTADWHLSHKPPTARSTEEDWYAAMGRSLSAVLDLAEEHAVPILMAGDLFDRWSSPPRLINWMLERLRYEDRRIYAVPGQHDLPEHSYEDINRSAFQTLVEAGAIIDVTRTVEGYEKDFETGPQPVIHGATWGDEIKSIDENDEYLDVLLAHSFCWIRDHGYSGASSEDRLSAYSSRLKGYDVAVFGDNHQAFTAMSGDCRVVNCGCLMRRKTSEMDYEPSVWLLRADKSVERIKLDTSADKWIEDPGEIAAGSGEHSSALQDVLEELKGLDHDSLDFREAVLRFIHDNEVKSGVKRLLLEAIGEEK